MQNKDSYYMKIICGADILQWTCKEIFHGFRLSWILKISNSKRCYGYVTLEECKYYVQSKRKRFLNVIYNFSKIIFSLKLYVITMYFEIGENLSGIALRHVKFNCDLHCSRIRVTTSIYAFYSMNKMLIREY